MDTEIVHLESSLCIPMVVWLRIRSFTLAATFLFAPLLQADVPATDGAFPNGSSAGQSVEISLSGKVKPWPPKFWCSNPKVKISAGEKSPSAKVTIEKDAEQGPCLIRVFNDEGSSEPFIFMVGEPGENEVIEDEKAANRSLSDAQAVDKSLPCAIYGRLNPSRDVDCYRIPLEKGQTLYASLEGYSFRTGLDSILHLYDPKGARVVLAHDNAVNLDPELEWKVAETGEHTLAVMAFATPPNANVSFHGGTKCSYRINLALDRKDIPGRLLPAKQPDSEKPGDKLTPPVDLFRTLAKPGQTDTFLIAAKAKEQYQIDVLAMDHRFRTDPVLVLKRPDGRLIKEVDDAAKTSRDSGYLWKVTQDGDHELVISDRFGKGGPEFRYQLKISPPEPSVSAAVEKSHFTIEAGKELELTVKLTRGHSHDKDLKLEIKNLPDSLSFDPPDIPKKSGDIKIKLKAKKEANAFSGPMEIKLIGPDGDSRPALFTFQDKDARGPYLINDFSSLWLTVKPAKKETEKAEK